MKLLISLTLLLSLLTVNGSCASERHADEELEDSSRLSSEPGTDSCVEYNYKHPHCCTPPDCKVMVSWRDGGEGTVEFTVVTKVTTNSSVWTALGFSEDRLMGNTDVVTCWLPEVSSSPQLHNGWIPADVKNVMIQEKTTLSIKLLDASVVDGKLHCSFSRQSSPNTTLTREKALTQPLHLLVASGPLRQVSEEQYEMRVHTSKVASECLCDFTDCQKSCVCMSGIKYLLLKLHGVVMTIGFVFFMPTGALISRYYRIVFAPSWFRAHVSMMVFGVACGLAGLGLILGHTSGRFTVGYHQIVGVVCLSLSVLQPLVGIIRPAVGPTLRRRLFNIFHRAMALLILNLGVAALLLGMYIFASTMMLWMLVAVGLSVVTNMAFMLLLEFFTRTQKFSSTMLPPVGYHKVTKDDELSESEEEVFVRDLPSKLVTKKSPAKKPVPYRFEQTLLLMFVVQSFCFAAVISGLIYFYDSTEM